MKKRKALYSPSTDDNAVFCNNLFISLLKRMPQVRNLH